MTDSHRLPPNVHERIFRERIVPELLTSAAPQTHPVAILLGGQPGVGKSSTKGALHEALVSRGGAVDFSADLMRPYHTGFTDLLRGDERVLRDLDTAIDEDARAWVDKAVAYASDRRINVIFDSNLANAERARSIIAQFTDAGYQTEVVFIAGSSALSRLGVLERYQRQIEEQGIGAYCPPKIHDRNYQGVLGTAKLIDTGEIVVDAVNVYRRGGGNPLHTNRRNAHRHWVNEPCAQQAIADERLRPWSPTESSWFISKATDLADRLADPFAGDLREAVERAQPLLQPVDRLAGTALAAKLAARADPPAPSPARAAFPQRPSPGQRKVRGSQQAPSPPPADGPSLGPGPARGR